MGVLDRFALFEILARIYSEVCQNIRDKNLCLDILSCHDSTEIIFIPINNKILRLIVKNESILRTVSGLEIN